MGDHVSDWAQEQTLPWAAAAELTREAYARGLAELNALHHDIAVFDIADGEVTVRDSPVQNPVAYNRDIAEVRVSAYRDLFAAATAQVGLERPLSIAMGLGDTVTEPPGLPIFGYQRGPGSRLILLPDIDFLANAFYEPESRDMHPDEKRDGIVFCGASTGMMMTAEDVAGDRSERLRYAARFLDHPSVTVRIGLAAQCLSPEAEALLIAKPYFEPIAWTEQTRHRYVLSIDGNGATCSRVVRTLRSRSVLLKTGSPHALYYFSGLTPWRHYIPVESPEDLAALAERITRPDFPADDIRDAANRFYEENLTREKVTAYTGELLTRFERDVIRRLAA